MITEWGLPSWRITRHLRKRLESENLTCQPCALLTCCCCSGADSRPLIIRLIWRRCQEGKRRHYWSREKPINCCSHLTDQRIHISPPSDQHSSIHKPPIWPPLRGIVNCSYTRSVMRRKINHRMHWSKHVHYKEDQTNTSERQTRLNTSQLSTVEMAGDAVMLC